jgi:hypothetical protein
MSSKLSTVGLMVFAAAMLGAMSVADPAPPSCGGHDGSDPRILDCYPAVPKPATSTENTAPRVEILALGVDGSAVMPGLLVEERSVQNGAPVTLPLPRKAFNLRVDLPLANIASPNPGASTIPAISPLAQEPVGDSTGATSGDIQNAVTDIQVKLQEYSMMRPSSLNLTRGNIVYSVDLVDQWEDVEAAVGVSASYELPILDAGLKADFEVNRTSETKTALIRMVEPLFTISLVDDALASAADYVQTAGFNFSDWFKSAVATDAFGPRNAPAYVQSVTYGRMFIVSATTNSSYSRTAFQSVLSAAAKGDLASKDNACVHAEYCKLKENLSTTFRYFTVGGSETAALSAINSGSFTDFFSSSQSENDCATWMNANPSGCTQPQDSTPAPAPSSGLSILRKSAVAGGKDSPVSPGFSIDPASYLTAVPISFRANYLALPRTPVEVQVPKGKIGDADLTCPKHWDRVKTGSGVVCTYGLALNPDVTKPYTSGAPDPDSSIQDAPLDAILWADHKTKACSVLWPGRHLFARHCNHGQDLADYRDRFPKDFTDLYQGALADERTAGMNAKFCFSTYSATESLDERNSGCWTDGAGHSILVNCGVAGKNARSLPGYPVRNSQMAGSEVCVPASASGCVITKMDHWTDIDWRHGSNPKPSKNGCVRGIYNVYLQAQMPPKQPEVWKGCPDVSPSPAPSATPAR